MISPVVVKFLTTNKVKQFFLHSNPYAKVRNFRIQPEIQIAKVGNHLYHHLSMPF
jgi:hypothetical protein